MSEDAGEDTGDIMNKRKRAEQTRWRKLSSNGRETRAQVRVGWGEEEETKGGKGTEDSPESRGRGSRESSGV